MVSSTLPADLLPSGPKPMCLRANTSSRSRSAADRQRGGSRARRPGLGHPSLLLKGEGRDPHDVKELKAALQGPQPTGGRSNLGLGARSGQRKAKDPEICLRFDMSAEEPGLRFLGSSLDCCFHLGYPHSPEEHLNVEDEEEEEEEEEETSTPSVTTQLLADMLQAPPSTTFSLAEDFVDVWNEDEEIDDFPAALPAREKAAAPVFADIEQAHRVQLNQEFASHFVQAVMDSTLIQAVRGPRCVVTPRCTPPTMGPAPKVVSKGSNMRVKPVVPELDMSALEAELQLLREEQLSAPPSPAASTGRLQPSLPSSPTMASTTARDWETTMHMQPTATLTSCSPAPVSPTPASPSTPDRRAITSATSAPALTVDVEGSPLSKHSRGSLRACKSHRRIIGGVVRTPVPAAAGHGTLGQSVARAAAATSPQAPQRALVSSGSKVQKSSRSSKDPSQRGSVVFRMDFDEPTLLASEGSAAARGSSLASRYDALGAELFCMQDEVDLAKSVFGKPARLDTAVGGATGNTVSAMALDLCGDSSPPVPRVGSTPMVTSPQQVVKSMKKSHSGYIDFKQPAFTAAYSMDMAASKKKQGLLPDLPSNAPCSGSLAWTRRLNRPGNRYAITGHGALGSAF